MRYGLLSRLLHQLALGNRCIAEASFDVEMLLHRPKAASIVRRKHVFVAGLARAGTTMLMRRFFASGAFGSLTYRDMPFVLMPRTWAWLSASSRRVSKQRERAHGDGVMVDYDSPEALEEVFWRVFAGDRYLRPDRLIPMAADDEIIGKLRNYVAAVLDSHGGESSKRYLSKNNNNVLRIPSLYRAFPEAVVIVPFREPAQQADSLLAQHRRFVGMHRADRFAREYMAWLGHHEFGSDHRPFRFPGDSLNHRDPDSLDYWIGLWINTYTWLLANAPEAAVFLGYDELCNRPADVWPRLASVGDIPADLADADPIAPRRRELQGTVDPGLRRLADAVHVRLAARGIIPGTHT